MGLTRTRALLKYVDSIQFSSVHLDFVYVRCTHERCALMYLPLDTLTKYKITSSSML